VYILNTVSVTIPYIVFLIVSEKPKIIEGPRDQVAQENSDVLFQCVVTGDPAPTVIWRKLDGQITPDRYFLNIAFF